MMFLLHSSLARVRCASGRNRNNFFKPAQASVKSSRSSPGAPGINTGFTTDKNKQKHDPPSSYLGFVALSVIFTLFPSNMHANLDLTKNIFALPLLSHFIPILYAFDMVEPSNLKDACHIRQEWVCSLYIPRVSETQRIECLLGV